ncbi:NAD(P)-binding protein [Gloeopeniophorella convolvens]|nr:NAD(P)-binding protein [Gloeopeniophorella convolvens]
MHIAVTGSSGSVGQRVVQIAIREGHSVLGLDRTPIVGEEDRSTFLAIDLRDFLATLDALRGCDAVVHLAAHRNPGDYLVTSHNDNVVISYNVLRACAELGINRVAQASSINVVRLLFSSAHPQPSYFPIDEDHPCEPDEPYGLSKLAAELQADSLVRRYPSLRIASLRFAWSLPSPTPSAARDPSKCARDMWAWVHEDAVARGALLALTSSGWEGHERFFLVAPDIAPRGPGVDSRSLREEYYPNVPVKEGYDVSGRMGMFRCEKAERVLGWVHWESGGD